MRRDTHLNNVVEVLTGGVQDTPEAAVGGALACDTSISTVPQNRNVSAESGHVPLQEQVSFPQLQDFSLEQVLVLAPEYWPAFSLCSALKVLPPLSYWTIVLLSSYSDLSAA